MDIEKILTTVLMIGADLPAYEALLAQVMDLFDDTDQDKLKAAYAEARATADKAHAAAQNL